MEIANDASNGLATASMVVLAALMVLTALYAHLNIPRYTARTATIARAVLIVVGLGLGAVSAVIYTESGGAFALLAFLIGFGVVHVPTAVILALKRARGAGKS
jgi:hypothetical protein